MKILSLCKNVLAVAAVVGLFSSCNMEDHKKAEAKKTTENHEGGNGMENSGNANSHNHQH